MTSTEVRSLTPADREDWEPLWAGYQSFYQTQIPAETTGETWRRFHDPLVPMHALGAFHEGRLVGIVHYLFHHSTWTAGPYCYLQDLFTAPEARGRGVGRALIEAVAAAARAAGASRVYWLTHETNAQAMALYDQVATRSGFVQYRRLLG
ncbi:MAG TPA: GNAT family N-acetyltransferase [Chloroflexaceae bacterium]|nr:GNAT family N-acetyltransferase [Chloroflexaceae bacterium]